jgi:hypothetical protein
MLRPSLHVNIGLDFRPEDGKEALILLYIYIKEKKFVQTTLDDLTPFLRSCKI